VPFSALTASLPHPLFRVFGTFRGTIVPGARASASVEAAWTTAGGTLASACPWPTLFLGDGTEWVWNLKKDRWQAAVELLDFYDGRIVFGLRIFTFQNRCGIV
jgi:hypothetical protein